jgi:hypothetical protein
LALDEPQTTSSRELVEGAHGLGGLVRETAIFFRRLVADLPGAIHLVAEAPELDVPGLFTAVGDALVAPLAAAGMIDVFEEGAGLDPDRASRD